MEKPTVENKVKEIAEAMGLRVTTVFGGVSLTYTF